MINGKKLTVDLSVLKGVTLPPPLAPSPNFPTSSLLTGPDTTTVN